MTVHDLMTAEARCARPGDSIAHAACDMRDLNVGALPVCGEEDKLVGMITDRDIATRAIAEGADPNRTSVREVMSNEIVCCYEDDDIATAGRLMEQKQIRRLPVLNRKKRLVGILSLGDLAVRNHDDRLSGKTLHKVSEPGGQQQRAQAH